MSSEPASAPPRVEVTPAAAELLRRLQDRHGPLMFHQSGGCCDGSSPMCYPAGEFIVGDRDVLLGVLDVGAGVPVWISGPQYEAWQHTQLIIDVVPGPGSGFQRRGARGGAVSHPQPRLHRRRDRVAEQAAAADRRRLRGGAAHRFDRRAAITSKA
ncbi:hypothetical protein C731_0662 [Mycolicibacterium hassiacum DSM 44199]|uniref:DUF779 domain-containing protein n=1 Tax=Mycolicibacterium hassiacum (strain DSM 44199 / CIP 105218 / JCM 12690 / 3849) TaxID=1122247 RepID=K5BHX7_MYCHD|nr:hypothetical protein C731_0662 [Mycolicibacterium hassiacum DSM 44199]